MRHAWATCLAMVTVAAGACGDDPVGPGDPPGGPATSLEIGPGAVLLTDAGATQQLTAFAIDASGGRTPVAATFRSSHPGTVTVSDEGLLTAVTAAGSTFIVAEAGGFTSPPILVLVAEPVDGALLVSDDQVVGEIAPVDPLAPYGPGWEYRVRLRGINPPVGQVVLASGGAPIGGLVVSTSPVGGETDVVLELLPLSGMFKNLSVNVQLPLANAPLAAPALRTGRGTASPAPFAARGGAARRIEQEFAIGNFECTAEIPPAFVFPITLDVVDVSVDPNLIYDVVIEGSAVRRLVAHGSIAARLSANPLVTAALEAKAECLQTVRLIILPIGGPVALIIGGQIPVGVGFEVGAKATFGQLGFDAFYEASLTTEFGIDCTAQCEVIAEMTTSPPAGFFKPRIPSFADDLRFALTGSAFGFAKLTIGNPTVRELRFETVKLKAGIEQSFDLAGRTAQANDPAYASTYTLKPVLEFKTSSKLDAVANLLEITLAELSFAPNLPVISESPRGSFTISPGSVAAGEGSALGETATFTVTLDPVDYFGAYAVETVDIFRRVGPAGTLEPGRPGCTRVEAVQDQAEFTCQADFLAEHAGSQEFFAFANTRIYGIPVPVPLEVAADGKAAVVVTTAPEVCPNIQFPGFGADADSVAKLTCIDNLIVRGGPVAFTALTQVLNDLTVSSGSATQVTFPVLSSIGRNGSFEFQATALDLSSLRSVGGGLFFVNMLEMVSLTIGGATIGGGGMAIEFNPKLSDISGVSCGLVIQGQLSIRNNASLSQADALAKADCITAGTKLVSGNGP
ncbi:MAG TPA: hypothetical protein VFT04_03050 [Gemmatimonadales bacterium]|nr:hypothetical protein [Gemmatimonadales bacterium]